MHIILRLRFAGQTEAMPLKSRARPKRATPYFQANAEGRLQLCPAQMRRQGPHTLTGNVQQRAFSSNFLQAEVDVWIYLPPGYTPGDPWRYPCLYLHDGQNVFDAATAAFGTEWSVDETAECLILEGKMEPILIVAVGNTPQRIEHYTPFPDRDHGGGMGAVYSAFFIRELKPWVEHTFPARGGARYNAVAGSSLGGLSALHMAWTHPDVFGMVAALSPSLWWGGRKQITRMGGDPCPRRLHKIWLDAGTEEMTVDENGNQVPDAIDDLRTLRAVLLAHGYQPEVDLFYREVPGGTHDEAAWAARVGEVLSCLFPRISHEVR